MTKAAWMLGAMIGLVLVCGLTAAQDLGDADPLILFVGPEIVRCQATGPMNCLQVKDDPDADYDLLYAPIEGFNYTSGFEYELLVAVSEAEDSADGWAYALLEIRSKTRSLDGNTWVLDSYANADGELVPVLEDTPTSLTADANSMILGTGCSVIAVRYSLEGHRLTVGEIFPSEVACFDQEKLDQDAAITDLLNKLAAYAIVDDQLIFSSAQGETLLSLHVRRQMALAGTSWELYFLLADLEAVVWLPDGYKITLNFSEDGGLSGFTGCNHISGAYTTDGTVITLTTLMAAKQSCPGPGIMEQEAAYLDALDNTTYYELDGNGLTLFDSEGLVSILFLLQDD